MDNDTENVGTAKRTDVGYKRPPAEHRFAKGHRPAPRKPKPRIADETPAGVLWRLLQEERRVQIGKRWTRMSNAELLVRRAHELADTGNSTMRSLTLELLMRGQSPEEGNGWPTVIWRPDDLNAPSVQTRVLPLADVKRLREANRSKPPT